MFWKIIWPSSMMLQIRHFHGQCTRKLIKPVSSCQQFWPNQNGGSGSGLLFKAESSKQQITDANIKATLSQPSIYGYHYHKYFWYRINCKTIPWERIYLHWSSCGSSSFPLLNPQMSFPVSCLSWYNAWKDVDVDDDMIYCYEWYVWWYCWDYIVYANHSILHSTLSPLSDISK